MEDITFTMHQNDDGTYRLIIMKGEEIIYPDQFTEEELKFVINCLATVSPATYASDKTIQFGNNTCYIKLVEKW